MKRFSIGIVVIALMFPALGLVAAQTADPTEETTGGRPYLGVRFGPSAGRDGVVIAQVMVDSPAHQAGLQAGDIVTAVNGEAITVEGLAASIGTYQVGDVVTLTIERDGERQDIDVTLSSAPETFRNRRQERRGNRGNPGNRGSRGDDFSLEFGNRPFFGVALENTETGVVVQEVVPDSPAAQAGIETGDQITAINGETVTDARDVVAAIRALEAGTEITVTIDREDETQDITATLETGSSGEFFPNLPGRPGMDGNRGGRIIPRLPGAGLQIAPFILGVEGAVLNENSAQEFNVPQQDGFYVSRVRLDSPAAEAGLLAGDVITSINGKPVDADLNLRDLLPGMAAGDTLSLEVHREGETLTLELALPEVMMRGFPDRLPSPDEPAPTEETDTTSA